MFLLVLLSAYKPFYGKLFVLKLVKRARLYKRFGILCYINKYGRSSSKVLGCIATNIGHGCQQETSRKRYECYSEIFLFWM
jgi:hypothetical protein